MRFGILPSGNLLITANNRGREELAHDLRRGARDSAESTGIENARYGPDCGQYEFVRAEDLCALSDAPFIVEPMSAEADDSRTFDGKVWKSSWAVMGSRSIASIPARPAPSARRACSPPAPPSWAYPRRRRSGRTLLRTRRAAMPSAAW
jgi:hypothetical protein